MYDIQTIFILSLVLIGIGWMAERFCENVRFKAEGKFPKQNHTVLSGHREYSVDPRALEQPPSEYSNDAIMAECIKRDAADNGFDEAILERLAREKAQQREKEG